MYDSLGKTMLAVAAVKLTLAPAAGVTTLGIFLYAASRFPFSRETVVASLFDVCPSENGKLWGFKNSGDKLHF